MHTCIHAHMHVTRLFEYLGEADGVLQETKKDLDEVKQTAHQAMALIEHLRTKLEDTTNMFENRVNDIRREVSACASSRVRNSFFGLISVFCKYLTYVYVCIQERMYMYRHRLRHG